MCKAVANDPNDESESQEKAKAREKYRKSGIPIHVTVLICLGAVAFVVAVSVGAAYLPCSRKNGNKKGPDKSMEEGTHTVQPDIKPN